MYPVQASQYGTFSGVIELVYGRGFKQRWLGFLRLLGRGR
jgi:hypothetical protein